MEELNKEATEIVDEKIKEVASSLEKKENKKIKKVFKTKCFHCKDTEIVTLDNGMEYKMPYAEIEIPKDIAGLMISGILSDTLALTSPTTTSLDRTVVAALANIIEFDFNIEKR